MITSQHQKILFKNIITRPEYLTQTKERFFEDMTIRSVFPIVKEFWEKYKNVPTADQIRESLTIAGVEGVSDAAVDQLWSVDLRNYDEAWLRENTETFVEFKTLEQSAVDVVNFLRTTKIDSTNIKNAVQTVKNIITDNNNVDFAFSVGSVFSDPAAHKIKKNQRFSSGYDFIDIITGGGFMPKTLISWVGPPKVGKSLWLANMAIKAVSAGSNVCVVTLEMSEQMYINRMGSNVLNVPIKEYENFVNTDPVGLKTKLNDMGISSLIMPGELVVKEFPTSTLTVPELEAYIKRTEETLGKKFRLVVIDYLNIMSNWRNPHSENTYMKIKQLAEDVRAMAVRNEWTVLTATQAKQAFFDASDMTMSAASESSGLAATVDLMMGIIQTSEMYANNKYLLKVLANRGEGYKNAKKQFNVDYKYMRIEEDMSVAMSEDSVF